MSQFPTNKEINNEQKFVAKGISRQMLVDHVTKKLENDPRLSGLNPLAKENVLKFLVKTECKYSLRHHIQDIKIVLKKSANPLDGPPVVQSNEDRINLLSQKYGDKWASSPEDDDDIVDTVDFQDSYGSTALHQAVKENNLEEVKDLVIVKKARTSLTDNNRLTPYQLAENLGFHEIADFLKKFSN